MTVTRLILLLALASSVSVFASNADSQSACMSPESIEDMNEHKIRRTAHIKGGNAILLIALDPDFSAPEFDYGDIYRDEHFIEAMKSARQLLFGAGINEVVIWRLPRPKYGAAVGFKDGCAVSGYGEPDYHEKLVLMHKAFKKISKHSLDSKPVRESIKKLIMATDYSHLYKDEMVDIVIDNLRPLMAETSPSDRNQNDNSLSEQLGSKSLSSLDEDLVFKKEIELNHFGKARFQNGRSPETKDWSCIVVAEDENRQFIPKGTPLNIIGEKHYVEYGGTIYDCLSVFYTVGLVKKITCKTSCDPYGHEYQLERQHLTEVLGNTVQQESDVAPKPHRVQMPPSSYDEQSFMEFALTIFEKEEYVEARKKCEMHNVRTQTDAFLECQERQVKENPVSPEAQYLLGVGYVYAGKKSETWKQYEILKSKSVNFSKLLLDVIVHVRPELLQRK